MRKAKPSAILLLVAVLAVFACRKKPAETPPEEEATFDKHAMLTSIADNVILPAYGNFSLSLDSVISAFASFSAAPSVAGLQPLRVKFDHCYLLYQRISPFGFGPGEEESVRLTMNVFPADTAKINSNIALGGYELAWPANTAAKGFPALDFLFYGYKASDARIVSLFTLQARCAYVTTVLNDMRQRITRVMDKWNSGYKASFIGDAGTDVGSPIGYLINQMNFELDYLKNAKIATPLGLRSDNVPKPDNSEALYNGQSLIYATETLRAIEQIYRGGTGSGFDDYIDHLGLTNGAEALSARINAQFTAAYSKLAAVGGPIPEKVLSDKTAVEDAYRELVKLLVLLKADLPSGIGVIITYQDGDGD